MLLPLGQISEQTVYGLFLKMPIVQPFFLVLDLIPSLQIFVEPTIVVPPTSPLVK